MAKQEGILFRYRWLWHILFWIMCFWFYTITYGTYYGYWREEMIANLYLVPVRILGTYAFSHFILVRYLLRKKYTGFIILAFVHAVVYAFGIWTILWLFVYCQGCVYDYEYPYFYIQKILGILVGNYGIVAIAAMIKIFKRWYIDNQQAQELQRDKLEAELKFLKSQINPHFLFNTLNNLYALTLKKSDKASHVVLKLSGMLDYILYESNEDEVPLESELKLIDDYIELEKVRYGKRLKFNYTLKGEPKGKMIAPLILLPFIENAFKHGVSQNVNNPFIDVLIRIEEYCLKLKVKNSSCNDSDEKEKYTEGIGLKNVKRRLEILYGGNYELKIEPGADTHEVYLCISWSVNKILCNPESNLN